MLVMVAPKVSQLMMMEFGIVISVIMISVHNVLSDFEAFVDVMDILLIDR